IPKPFDWRALLKVAPAVAKAAMDSGVARKPIADFEAYRARLERILGRDREVMRHMFHKASRCECRVAFPESTHPKILRAAQICVEERICVPVLVGDAEHIRQVAAEHDVDLTGCEVVDPASDPRRKAFTEGLWARLARQGVTHAEAQRRLRNRLDFAAMMVTSGQVAGLVTGMTRSYPDSLRPLLQVVGPAPGVRKVAGAHVVILRDSVKVFADTTVNIEPDAQALADITLAAAQMARELDLDPKVALLSFSNFGSSSHPQARKVRDALARVHAADPSLVVDGEMQLGPAIDAEHRERIFPFSSLDGEANVLVFPDLNAANLGYKLLAYLGDAELVGPLLMGMDKPVNIVERDASVRAVVHVTAMTVVQAQDLRARQTTETLGEEAR
ncbi:MAG: NADP-dependent malic enzyme, partial [Myxococcales bacterium]|nr:NADP-dependent malic enzyme [Myxococcales bacterium]